MVANDNLKSSLTATTKTTMRLSLMFLRMRETKQRIVKKCRHYETMAHDFSNSIHEQSQLMSKMNVVATKGTGQEDYIQLESFSRIGELLCEIATLRLKLGAISVAGKPSRRDQKKLTKQLISKLVKGLLCEQNQYREIIADITTKQLSPNLRRTFLFGSEITIFDLNQILMKQKMF